MEKSAKTALSINLMLKIWLLLSQTGLDKKHFIDYNIQRTEATKIDTTIYCGVFIARLRQNVIRHTGSSFSAALYAVIRYDQTDMEIEYADQNPKAGRS